MKQLFFFVAVAMFALLQVGKIVALFAPSLVAGVAAAMAVHVHSAASAILAAMAAIGISGFWLTVIVVFPATPITLGAIFLIRWVRKKQRERQRWWSDGRRSREILTRGGFPLG